MWSGVLAVGLAAGMGVVVGAPANAAGSTKAAMSTAGTSSAGAAAAVSRAVATGQPVVVSSLTTPTQSAVANPDGSVTMTIDAGPVRVQQPSGSWSPIDTGLVVSGSTIAPKAASVSMSFSDGGASAPLATITQAGHSYSLLSPWTLPTPVIAGSTATYMAVQPGVDLVVQAFPDGFSDNLVVETPAAAAALVASPAAFAVKTTGVSQVQDPVSGTVREIGADGATVFSGDAPSMWDSTGASVGVSSQRGTAAGAAAAVTAESPSARVAPMVETVSGSSVRLAPSSAMLATPGLTYPLVLDPVTKTQSISGWTVLDREFASHAYWKDSPDPAGDMSVGYDFYETGSVRRSVVQFNTSAVAGKHVLAATFTPYDAYSASCTGYEVDLYRTSTISSASSWNSPPSWSAKVDSETFAKGHDSGCPAGIEQFIATDAVSYTAGQSSSTTTLGMRATSAGESTQNDWKQFLPPSNTSHPPVLSVTYVSKPSTPTGVAMSAPALSCSTSSSSPTYIITTTPTLKAILADADGSSATMRGNFQVYNGATKTWSANSSGLVASGATVTATTSALATNVLYYYQARTEYQWSYNGPSGLISGSDFSGWSTPCYFEVDTTAPAAPTVSSSTYGQCASPDNPDVCTANGGVGQPATFTFVSSNDTTTFLYTLNSGGQQSVPAHFSLALLKTTAAVQITPTGRGVNFLQVQAQDAAGNRSTSDYDFKVAAGSDPVGVWNLDETSGTTAADSTDRGTAHPATLGTGATWNTLGRTGGSLLLNGTSGYAATTTPITDTSNSYAVSAWVYLATDNQPETFVSQSGTNTYAFALGFTPTSGWLFEGTSADVTAPTLTKATSTLVPNINAWTHLTGVYDAVAKTMRLYVNGVSGPTVAYTTAWNATGALNIGRDGPTSGTYGDYTHGHIDNVQVWDRILAPQEIFDNDEIVDPSTGLPTPAVQRQWPVTATSGTDIQDLSGYNHDLSIAGTDGNTTNTLIDDPTRAQVIQLNGTTQYASDYWEGADPQGSFTANVWVNLQSATLGTGARTAVVLSQNSSVQATWSLWYAQTAGPSTGFWYFGRTSADWSGATTTTLASDNPAQTDGWTMLSVVYDAPNQAMHLYINGIEQGAPGVAFGSAWQSFTSFTVGRGLVNGAWVSYFPGMVDDLDVSTGVTDQTTLFTQYINELITP